MQKKSLFSHRWVKGSAVVAATALSLAVAAPAYAAPLASVKSATAQDNVVTITFNDGIQGKITLLEDGIFRYNVDPKGEFSAYATPKNAAHTAKIQAQPDTSSKYSRPQASVKEEGGKFVISAANGKTTIEFDKATAKMTVKTDGTVVMEESAALDLDVKEEGGKFVISAANGKTTIEFDKATAKMTVKTDGTVVMEESAALDLDKSGTVQKLVKHEGENFFGGGTQNGRFIHTGKTINIANESNWVDGGVASPNPFYWSSKGYGVLRNTFADGSYDFGKSSADATVATHKENELDAYYFVADAAKGASTAPIAQDLLQGYFKVTGNPVLLPEYAFYVGHLNAWNRDMWSADAKGGYNKWQIKGSTPASENGGKVQYEKGGTGTTMQPGTIVETLNGTGPTEQAENIPEGVQFSEDFSARARLDNYQDNDMPFGYFLPNDGYGAGYGQNGFGKTGGVDAATGKSSEERLAAVAANVKNLQEFTKYANGKGVATGLWTQSYLTPDANPATQWQLLRDFRAEVKTGGVTTLKTDVAWVGPGYSMALDGTKTAYDIVTEEANFRPNIITLDGWAGTQRFGAIWTGDQTGGNWEYIRFHVPTFIGQSLSGNPNIGSDNDGIFGGQPIIATRDYQWKSFAPLMLDMDGWGSYAKAPQTHGDPYTGISRMYLKLKSQLMPYIYTTAASAANIDTGNGDTGMPFVRAILLSEDSAYANSTATQYEYTMGEDFLIAPIYQNTDGDAANKGLGDGNDVRNGIYLPGGKDTIWIDYFSGKQYRGGQVLNNFDAPLWKLPVFVKANAIVPMYNPNNSPEDVDRTIRNVEFFATEGKNEYTLPLWKLPVFVKANAIVPMYNPNNSPEDVDRTIRNVEFFATEGKNEYTLFEDTGKFVENTVNESDKAYGRESTISYGSNVKTTFKSEAKGGAATFTAGKSTGTYDGYKKDRTTTFIVNVSEKPQSIVAKNGGTVLTEKKVDSQDAFDKAVPAVGEVVTFYNTKPNLNYNATAESEAVRNESFSKQEVATTPKLYVKFAKTDVQANEQTLEIKGFKNDGKLPSDEVKKDIAAPKLNQPGEDDLTPTSVNLSWNKIDKAIGYDIMIDGMLNSIPSGESTSFNVTGLEYFSEHTFKIRTRTAEGVSEWSAEMKTRTLEDPWRNAPKPVNIDWKGGDGWGKLDNAFDHNDKSESMFHSTDSAIGMPMTLDYGKSFQLDKFVYTPRQDNGGNGNVAEMKVETSMDGAHWTNHGVQKWDNTGAGKMAQKTVELDGTTARYLRLTVQKSAGGFFSATELALYKVDETEGMETGSLKAPVTVGDEDYQHLGNCVGRENHGSGVTDWNSHVAQSSADFNLNGAYDVYDMSFTMSKLDGGTKQKGKVAGAIAVVPEKTSVKKGETITVSVKVQNAKNVNAMGALVRYPVADFEFVGSAPTVAESTKGMENKSGHYTFGDENNSVNIALANKGDKALYKGSEAIATFQLKAKKDCEVKLDSQAWLVGPAQDFLTDKSGELGPEIKELGQDAFNITMTNAKLPKDDGTNVAKLVESKKYDGLFDNKESGNDFEFKWDLDYNHDDSGKLPEYVMLPTTMHFELKEPRALQDVEILNRKSSNGSINSMEAVITYTDGSKSEFKGGDFAKKQDVYTLKAEAGKLVKSIEITPLTSDGNRKSSNGSINSMEAVITYTDGSKSEFKGGDFAKKQDVYTLKAEAGKLVKSIEITPLTSDGTATGYQGDAAKNRMLTLREINFHYVEGEVQPPVDEVKEMVQDDFKITMTNDSLKSDDGTNVSKLIQQGNYNGLFDNKETSNDFEFKWDIDQNYQDGKLPEYVKLPTTMHFELKSPRVMRDVQVVNRDTYNGTVTSMQAVITYTDGSKSEFKGGDFAKKQAVYTLKAEAGKLVKSIDITPLTSEGEAKGYTGGSKSEFKGGDFAKKQAVYTLKAEAGKLVKSIDITPLTSEGEAKGYTGDAAKNRMLTLREINFHYSDADKPVTPEVNKAALLAKYNEVKDIKADGYTADSWKAFADARDLAKRVLDSDKAGQADVDAALKQLTDAHAALKKEEAPQVNKTALEAAVEEARALKAEDYKTMTWHPFAGALESAEKVLADAKADQKAVDAAAKALADAKAGLKKVEKVAFVDVDKETSHRAEVEWLAANGISKGWENADGTSSFRPYATVKRADMAAFLYRLAGEPAFDAKDVAFTDVDEKTPHRDAILWLASEGISTGWKGADGKAEFRPYAEITRCDMAAFLYRMAGEPEFEAKDAFADIAKDAPHREAVLWLAASGVSTGWTEADGTKTFRPYEQIVRCDMAAFLQRMAEKDLVDLK